MYNITVLNIKNYFYKCYNCGSDSEDSSHSIKIEMKTTDSNIGFYLCPKCALLI